MKTILLVGSSIFQAWSNAKNIAPEYNVKNRAIGGTITAYWTEHLPAILTEEVPDIVLFYCGSNDINCNISEADIIENVAKCRKIIRSFSQNINFAYFSIIKAPQKRGRWKLIDNINTAINNELSLNDLYIETNNLFFADNGPVERFFIEDELHLTSEAYDELSTYTQPLISAWMKNNI